MDWIIRLKSGRNDLVIIDVRVFGVYQNNNITATVMLNKCLNDFFGVPADSGWLIRQ